MLCSYELETDDYPLIILLHLLRIPSSTHFPCGHGNTTVVENWPFYTSGLMATTSDKRLSIASNVGFVKQKA